jgi:hypothetical protein
MKDPVQRSLAFKILAWLSHALGGLTVKALQEAPSMKTGDERIDEEKQIPVDDLISVCSGLVDLVVTDTVDGTQIIRLLHETARVYLKNIGSDSFPRGHEIILKACLAYLSLPEFSKTESPAFNYKKTFLIWAAELGRIFQAEFLLRCGSDVNAADIFGNTGLHYAVNNRNLDMVKLLIEKGSNLTKVGHGGITPLTAAEKTGNKPIKEYLEKALLKQSQNS